MPGKCLTIDAVESELGPESVRPLEVIEQAPHVEPAYVHAVVESSPHTTQDLHQIGDSLGVVVCGDPTLGQEYR